MNKNTRISVSQLVCLLLVSRMTSAFTASPASGIAAGGSGLLLSALLQAPLLLLLFLPTWWFGRRTNRAGTLDYAYVLFGKKGGGVLAVLYGLLCLLVITGDLLRFQTFVSVALSPDMSRVALAALLTLCVFFAASCGFQAIARAAGVAAVVMTLLLVFVALTLLPEMEAIHFLSPFYEGTESVVRGALMELPRCLEVTVIGLLLPYVNGNAHKGYAVWTGALSALLIVMQATVTGVLGDFADEVRFPFYAAVTAADVGFLQRMDIVALAVWMVALFVKMAFYGTLYMSAAQRLFGDRHKPLLGWAGGLAVLAVGLLLAGPVAKTQPEVAAPVFVLLAAVFAVAVPLILIAADVLQEKRRRRVQA